MPKSYDKRFVAVNDQGRRIGQDHPRAKLTDHEVELLLHLHEVEGWGYRRLGKKFDIGRDRAKRIIKGVNRCQTPAGYKKA